jgi:hypothetical protein
LILVAAALGGCSSSQDDAPGSDAPLNGPELQHLTCADWEHADDSARARILDGLHATLGGPVTGKGASGQGSVLSDELAQRLFDNYCSQSFARGFVLYKLFGQASGFAGEAPEP